MIKPFLICFVGVIFALNSFSQSVSNLVAQGTQQLNVQKYDSAVLSFSAAIKYDSTNAQAYFGRGQAYFMKGNDKLAQPDFNKAISITPSNPDMYYMRAQSRNYTNDHYGALDDYETVIKLDSNYISAYIGRAYVFLGLNQMQAAFVFFTIAINKQPNQIAETYFARGYCYQMYQAYRQALADYQKAISLKPNYSDPYLNSGNCMLAMHGNDSAMIYYQAALKINPTDAKIHISMGDYYHYKINDVSACEEWNKAVSLGDNNTAKDNIKKYCNK